MFRPVALYIGLRYTRARRRNHFISFISLTSMLSIAIGVMVLITVLSVMNGFDEQIHNRIFDMANQVTVTGSQNGLSNWQALSKRLTTYSEITGIAPYISGEGMLTYRGQVQPTLATGILPEYENAVSALADRMQTGSLTALKEGQFGMVIGAQMANNLGLNIGDQVNLLIPQASVTPLGVMPRYKRFTIVGIFSVGNGLGFDSELAFIHLSDAQKLFQLSNKVSGLRLRLHNLYSAPQLTNRLALELNGDYQFSDWTEQYGALFQAISLEKTMMFLVLLLLIGIAAFNLVSTLVMVVTEKRSDIAILRTLGATPAMIRAIFIIQGSVIGLLGTFLGLVAGIYLAEHATQFVSAIEHYFHIQLLSSNIYYVNYLPSKLIASDVIKVCLSALGMSLIATLYPAWHAARIQPAEALRYE